MGNILTVNVHAANKHDTKGSVFVFEKERTFAWIGNSRRLSKDYEITASTEENMVIISHFHTLLRRSCVYADGVIATKSATKQFSFTISVSLIFLISFLFFKYDIWRGVVQRRKKGFY